jgi:hypothetical protein
MKDPTPAIIANDRTLPEQYLQTYRRSEYLEPERALLAALLEDAIACYFKHRSTRDPPGKETRHEAEQWLMTDQDDWIFSFRNVCDLLGLDAEYIRRGLLQECRRETSVPRRRYKHRRQAA